MVNQPIIKLNTKTEMPLLGLGVYDMYNAEAQKAVEAALEIGYRLIDTAAMYENEKEIGNAIYNTGLRSEIFLTTKVNNLDQGYDTTLRAIETSLKKLKTDYVDLYLIHWPIKASRKETWQALEHIYSQGLAKAIGVANYLEPFLAELKTYANIVPAVNQVEFSPFLNLQNLKTVCQNQNTVLQAYTPLTRGAKLNNLKLITIAEKYNKTSAQIILRWCMQLQISAIPKSSNIERLKENFNIFDFVIEDSDMHTLNNLNENFRMVDDPMIFW